jgi:GNAT superfamily N-acetyltransferase
MTLRIREFQPGDATALSTIICRCLREVNSVDYSSAVIEELAKSFTPEKIARFPEERSVFVAEFGGTAIGTASLARDNRTTEEKYVCLTVFVLPDHQGTGVGKALMKTVECAARGKGADNLQVPSSITALPFYTKLGYTPVSDLKPKAGDHWVFLTKRLKETEDGTF